MVGRAVARHGQQSFPAGSTALGPQPEQVQLRRNRRTRYRIVIDDQHRAIHMHFEPLRHRQHVRRQARIKAQLDEEAEAAALTRNAVDADPAVHQVYQPLANRQPEPGAAVTPRRRRIGLSKRVEQA